MTPEARGRGLGQEVIRGPLEACDSSGVGAYLSSTNERSVGFYRRLGFDVIDVVVTCRGAVEFRQMWRSAGTG